MNTKKGSSFHDNHTNRISESNQKRSLSELAPYSHDLSTNKRARLSAGESLVRSESSNNSSAGNSPSAAASQKDTRIVYLLLLKQPIRKLTQKVNVDAINGKGRLSKELKGVCTNDAETRIVNAEANPVTGNPLLYTQGFQSKKDLGEATADSSKSKNSTFNSKKRNKLNVTKRGKLPNSNSDSKFGKGFFYPQPSESNVTVALPKSFSGRMVSLLKSTKADAQLVLEDVSSDDLDSDADSDGSGSKQY